MGSRCNHTPSRGLWHEKNIFGRISILIVFKPVTLLDKSFVPFFKSAGNIAQENQSYDYFSIIGCRDVSPKNTSRIPYFLLKPHVCIAFLCCHITFAVLLWYNY